jgi:hypothetical protein
MLNQVEENCAVLGYFAASNGSRFNINDFTFCSQNIFVRFVCISESTVIISLYSIN